MAGAEWLNLIKAAEKTAIIKDGHLKVHYKFPNGHEMAEDYNISSNILTRRAWRKKSELRSAGEWEIEVGDPEPQLVTAIDTIGLKESSSNPYVIRRITKENLEWRIRNLSYPPKTYTVTADQNEKCIIVRTSNKKYYKKLNVPELDRTGVVPTQESLDFTHKYNTLIITYKKPLEVIKMEEKVLQEIKNVKSIDNGNFDCNPS